MPFRCVLLAALLCAGAAARPEEPRLVRKWEKILGAPGATPWLTAVCPNGVFYAVDGRGRAVALNADGDMIAESEGERALFRVRALACDSDNLLYAARTDNIAVLRAAANRFETVREARPEVDIYAMTIGARGRIYAAGRRPGSRLPLHVLEPDGRVLLSFGERQRGQVYPPFQPQSLPALAETARTPAGGLGRRLTRSKRMGPMACCSMWFARATAATYARHSSPQEAISPARPCCRTAR